MYEQYERWADMSYTEAYVISDSLSLKNWVGEDREIAKDLWMKLAYILESSTDSRVELTLHEMWLIVLSVSENYHIGGKPVGKEVKVKMLSRLRDIELEKATGLGGINIEELETSKNIEREENNADTN